MDVTITHPDRQQFLTHGYLIVRELLAEVEVTELDREIGRMAQSRQTDKSAVYYYETNGAGEELLRRIERIDAASALIRRLFQSDEIRGSVEALFGEPACLFKDKLNLKLPGGEGFRTHMDGHFLWTDNSGVTRKGWGEYGTWFINALISVDPATSENGCIRVASLQDTFAHFGRDFDEIVASVGGPGPYIPENRFTDVTMHALETQPGDVVFFDWRCIHGSASNQSRMSRRLLYATYNRASEGDHLSRYYEDKRTSVGPMAQKALGR